MLPEVGNCGQCQTPAWKYRRQDTDGKLIWWWIKGEKLLYWEGWHSTFARTRINTCVPTSICGPHGWESEPGDIFRPYQRELPGRTVDPRYQGLVQSGPLANQLNGRKSAEGRKCTACITGVAVGETQLNSLWRTHQRLTGKRVWYMQTILQPCQKILCRSGDFHLWLSKEISKTYPPTKQLQTGIKLTKTTILTLWKSIKCKRQSEKCSYTLHKTDELSQHCL